VGYNSVYNSLSCCWQLGSQICEIPRNSEVTAGQGHPRLSTLMSVESARATSY